MASGAVMLIFSFLAFYKVDVDGGDSWSAWSNAFNLFPLSTLLVIAGVALAAEVAVRRFADASIPDGVAGFSWSQLRLVLGALGTLVMLGYLIRSFGSEAGFAKGVGLFLTTLAMIGLVVSAVMERAEGGTESAAGAVGRHEPLPGDWLVIGGGVVILIGSFLGLYETGLDETTSAWGQGLFPLYAIPALLGVVMAAQVAASAFADVRIPDRVLGLSWREIHLVLGFFVAFMMVSFLIGRVTIEDADASKEIGFWIMLLASLALAAGAFLKAQDGGGRSAAPAQGQQQQQPPPPPAA